MEAFMVLKTKKNSKSWFGGNDLRPDKSAIGYSTYPDGINWTTTNRWDGYSVSDSNVVYHDGLYHIWYKGWRKKGGNAWIGYATSFDGLNWQRNPENPVLLSSFFPGSCVNYEIYRPPVIIGEFI